MHNWRPDVAPATHLGKRTEVAQSASAVGFLKATLKRQSRHKLVIGNWSITSLIEKEHELVEEAKWYSLGVLLVGISSTKCRRCNTVQPNDVWKLFYSGVEPAKFSKGGVVTHVSRQLAKCSWMDHTRRNGVHVEVGVVGPHPVFDTRMQPKLMCTVPRISGRNYWCLGKGWNQLSHEPFERLQCTRWERWQGMEVNDQPAWWCW